MLWKNMVPFLIWWLIRHDKNNQDSAAWLNCKMYNTWTIVVCVYTYVDLCACVWILAAARAVKRRRFSRGRLQLAHLLPRVRRPYLAHQRMTPRRTVRMRGLYLNDPHRTNSSRSLERVVAPRRYEHTNTVLTRQIQIPKYIKGSYQIWICGSY